MPSINSKKLLGFLQKKGFYITRQRASHVILHHEQNETLRVTVPFHNQDLKPGTLKSILKQAGLTKKDLFPGK